MGSRVRQALGEPGASTWRARLRRDGEGELVRVVEPRVAPWCNETAFHVVKTGSVYESRVNAFCFRNLWADPQHLQEKVSWPMVLWFLDNLFPRNNIRDSFPHTLIGYVEDPGAFARGADLFHHLGPAQ